MDLETLWSSVANETSTNRKLPTNTKDLAISEIRHLLALSSEALDSAFTLPTHKFLMSLFMNHPVNEGGDNTSSSPTEDQFTKELRKAIRLETANKLFRHLSGEEVVSDLSQPVIIREGVERILAQGDFRNIQTNYNLSYDVLVKLHLDELDRTNSLGLASYERELQEVSAALNFCHANQRADSDSTSPISGSEAGRLVTAVYRRGDIEKIAAASLRLSPFVDVLIASGNIPGMQEEMLENETVRNTLKQFIDSRQKILDLFVESNLDILFGPKSTNDASTRKTEGPSDSKPDDNTEVATTQPTKPKTIKPGRLF